MMAAKVGVVALKGDLHAQAVCHLAKQQDRSVFHFEIDILRERPSSLEVGGGKPVAVTLTDSSGVEHHLSDFGVIWWRRPYGIQLTIDESAPASIRSVIDNSARSHVYGLFSAASRGILLNEPTAAQHAENKAVQMKVAQDVGFATPRTLFSNSNREIAKFFDEMDGNIIVKSYFNSVELQIKTTMLTREMLHDKSSIIAAPCIYQSYIHGNEHFRIVAVQGNYEAVRFINPDVDSRTDLSVPAERYVFDEGTRKRIDQFLNNMGLHMGIIDLKMDKSGILYFLEVNQQGQFAYLDMITSTRCLQMVTDFLLHRVR